MSKSMLVNVTAEEEHRVAIVDNGVLDLFEMREPVDQIPLAVDHDQGWPFRIIQVMKDQGGEPLGLPCPGTADNVHVGEEGFLRNAERNRHHEEIMKRRAPEVRYNHFNRGESFESSGKTNGFLCSVSGTKPDTRQRFRYSARLRSTKRWFRA